MDEFDIASNLEALHRELLIEEIRNRKPIKFSGYCFYCNEKLVEKKFCDAWCREEYESLQKIKLIQGKRK